MRLRLGLVAWLGLSLAGSFPPALGQEFSGADLARRLGCWACHEGTLAAPLEGIGRRRSPEELQQLLIRPRTFHPGAKMPSYAYLRPGELEALVDWLRSLGERPGKSYSTPLPSRAE